MSKKETAISTISFEEDSNMGLEGLTKDDLAIPFLTILQSNSPQLMEDKQLRPGHIYDTVLKQGYEELFVVPCNYEKQYVEWTPRESGGGLRATYSASDGIELLKSCKKDDKGKDLLPNGNLLVPTAVYYVVYMHEELDGNIESAKAIISMTSTALKKSRRWNSIMASITMRGKDGHPFTPASFSHIYRMKTCPETNVHGSWFNWDIEMHGPVADEGMYHTSKLFAADMTKAKLEQAPPF
tara:strand:+ start:28 stop:747 length:720 start_codon:yes stop_codon:yes gene_type:complete